MLYGDNDIIGTFVEESATKGCVVSYNVRLVTLPSSSVLVKIIPSSPLRCSVIPPALTFSKTAWNIDQYLVIVDTTNRCAIGYNNYHPL